MIEVLDMSENEIEEVLARVLYGHLACSKDDVPYVVPIHYAYQKPYIYFYTTEGKKTEVINSNPNVCLQVEEVVDNTDWRSVVVDGVAERVTEGAEREKVLKLITPVNQTLTPAISIRWIDSWVRENREAFYRITPRFSTGRTALKVRISAAFAQPETTGPPKIL